MKIDQLTIAYGVARCARFVLLGILIVTVAVININASDTLFSVFLQRTPLTAPSVYIWQPAMGGDWQSPKSWAPARTNPAPDDVLVFNLGGTTTATNIPNQTIGQIFVSVNTAVNFQSAKAIILTIGGGDGDDLTVERNSAINFNSEHAIVVDLAHSATAKINGSIKFSSSASAPHRLTAPDFGAITFEDGSTFVAGTGFSGNPFGTANLDSVVFEGGSTYVCIDGSDPFGAVEPASVVTFKHGSLFRLQGNVTPIFTGRTYSNFEVNYPGTNFLIFDTGPMSIDDITITAGGIAFYQTGESGLSIKGNITLGGQGTLLSFETGTFRLNGTAPQVISGVGSTASSVNTLIIDNPMGIILQRPFGAHNVELINGVVTTLGPAWFSVVGVVTRTNGYINGYLRRYFDVPGTFVFDVGTENGYSPVTAVVTNVRMTSGFTIGAFQSAQPNVLVPSKALNRYWEIYAINFPTADLMFNYLDADIPATANEQNFVARKYNGTAFVQELGIIDTTANTFRVDGVTDFVRDWTLTEPGAVASPTATATPVAGNISGTVTYGNAIGSPQQRVVSNVQLSGVGSVPVSAVSGFPNGTYSLSGFGSGAYTVTPTKTGGANGAITSFDAGRIAQHVAGINPLTGNQLVVADVSGNGTLSSFDSAQIARYVAGLNNFGSTANWIFTPANRNYASVTGNITGEDFIGLLMGDVSGNWTNTAAR